MTGARPGPGVREASGRDDRGEGAGIYYAASHDPALSSRSTALFGKPADPDTDTADLTNVSIEPVPMSMVNDLAESFGYIVVTDTRPLT